MAELAGVDMSYSEAQYTFLRRAGDTCHSLADIDWGVVVEKFRFDPECPAHTDAGILADIDVDTLDYTVPDTDAGILVHTAQRSVVENHPEEMADLHPADNYD